MKEKLSDKIKKIKDSNMPDDKKKNLIEKIQEKINENLVQK